MGCAEVASLRRGPPFLDSNKAMASGHERGWCVRASAGDKTGFVREISRKGRSDVAWGKPMNEG